MYENRKMAAFCESEQIAADKLENYLISSAQKTLKSDLCAAKAWLLTAKVLYPHKFGVQFLAYQIEKTTKNLKDSAKCFAELLATFPSEPELRSEVLAMTSALRQFEEHEVPLDASDYLVQLFYQLPQMVQRGLLLNCANNTPDALDHCKLMLLLFRKFPNDLLVFGPEVMESLITAEKHSAGGGNGNPLNCFRKLLVCELLPLLAQSVIELQPQTLLRLLDKAVEFNLMCAFDGGKRSRREEREVTTVEDPWGRLWDAVLHIGAKLKWELTAGFTRYWSRDAYFKSLNMFSMRLDEASQRQIALCTLLVLLRCAHEYLPIVEPANQEQGFLLVEAFVQPDSSAGHSSKMQKTDEDMSTPILTAGVGAPPLLVPSFLAAVRCLETLHINEFVRREYLRLRGVWKADPWLHTFLMDAITYQGMDGRSMASYHQGSYDQVVQPQARTSEDFRASPIVAELANLTWHYRRADKLHIVDTIEKIAGLVGNIGAIGVSSGNQLVAVTRRMRHVTFLPITRAAILQYCVKVLLQVLKKRTSDLALGHTLVLMQLNWPLESDNLNEISELMTIRGGFGYSLFSKYIINIDIIERFAYLAGPNGPKLPLDIFAGTQIHSQRRMSTRGIDKGAKEDLRAAIRSQVARWNEPVDELIIRFLKCERELIQLSILN